MVRTVAHTLFLMILTIIVTCSAIGQVDTGVPPFSSSGGGSFDTVNLGNLNVHFAVPVVHKAGRGTPFTYDLGYDSSVWYPATVNGVLTWVPVFNWGWTAETVVNIGYVTYSTFDTPCQDDRFKSTTKYYAFVYHDAGGGVHGFGGELLYNPDPANCIPPTISTLNSTAPDNSGLKLSSMLSGGIVGLTTITTPHGTVLTPPLNLPSGSTLAAGKIADSNGNQINTDGSGHFYDTLSATTSVLTISGSGSPSSPVKLKYTAPSGAMPAYTINYVSKNVMTNFQCSSPPDVTINSVSLVSSIVLPDNSQYTFTYEPTPSHSGYVTGRLASVTLPTGGTINYTYTGANNGIICADGSAAGLSRQLSPGGTWGYVRSGSGSSWTTTVSDPNTPTNQTKINFQKDTATTNPTGNFYETQRLVYQGSTSGTLLSTTIACYNGNSVGTPANCPATAVASPITRKTVFNYLPNSSGSQAETDTTYDSTGLGLIKEVDAYDYGKGVVGSILKKTSISYATLTNNIQDRPASVTISDGTVASTTYTYDQGTPTGSGATQLNPVTGSRGNATTVATKANSTTTLSRTFTYYDTGMPNVLTDVNGAQTTYNYASSTSSCDFAFPTSISEPLSLSRSMTWNCIGGVLTSLTDENSKTSYVNYTTDPDYWRPESTQDQAGNITTLTYSPTQSESTLLFNSSNSVTDVLTTVDGFGRVIFRQTGQNPSPSNYDTVATCYDIVGRASLVTLPYSAAAATSSTACPTSNPGVSYGYDALNRVASASDSGGGSTASIYTNNDVYQSLTPAPSGENTKDKQLEYDGLGRVKSVCEITGTANGGGSCAQTNGKTGYWTKYGYNALGNLTGVTQNAQGSSQTRTYSYDMLGRLTSEANPENGTVTYSYDPYSFCWSAGADGDLHTRTDNAGNVTCYRHDLLHRLIDVARWANNAFVIGSCQRLRYDNASSGVVTPPVGYSAANTESRLIEAETDDCSAWPPTPTTNEWFSYSPRGETTDVYESTPNSGGYYHTTTSYFANGALNILSGVPGQTAWTYGLDGEGRPSTAVQGTTNLVTGVTYTPAGQPRIISLGAGDSDNYAYDPTTGRMTNYTFTVGSPAVSITGGLFWNPNGTLNKLQISDGFNAGGTQTCKYGDPSGGIPGYDDLGRLIKVDCGATVWQQNFSYDPFGNITKTVPTNGTGYAWNPGYSQASNRYTLSGTSYDNNGNLLNDTFHTYSWNPENHLTMIDTTTCGTANTACLTYDAFDRMVEKQIGASFKQILYSPIGKTAVMNGQTLVNAYIPLPGGATLNETPGQKNFWHSDWLGSARLSSTVGRTIVFDRAFAPFGETYNVFGQTSSASSFTGDTQDTFIVNGGTPEPYDTPNRELHPVQARWLSPDPAGLGAANPANPQSWNRYAYVTNNPLGVLDPLGLGSCKKPCLIQMQLNNDLGFYQAYGYGCQIEGMPAPCSVANQVLQSGAGVICPQCQPGQLVGQDNQIYGWQNPVYGANCDNSGCGPGYLKDPGGWEAVGTVSDSAPSAWSLFGWDANAWRTFFKTAANPLPELREGGCGRAFLDAFSEGGLFPDGGPGTEPDTLIKQAGTIAAAQYAINQGLVVPLRSSIYRGILEGTETAASSAVLLDIYTREAQGFSAEYSAFKAGACH